MASAQPNHDPALAQSNQNTSSDPQGQNNVGGTPVGMNVTQFTGMDQNQILTLLRTLPGGALFPKPGDAKDSDAAQTLSNLSQQAAFPSQSGAPQGNPFGNPHESGPSSHPRGPPNLGELSALASQSPPLSSRPQGLGQQQLDRGEDGGGSDDGDDKDRSGSQQPTSASGKRSGRSATMGSEEWTRQRKDNHKEVERRRRGNINDGINELGRIVPNGSGEKAKGAILSRAVQYIHHLKENEARNIEKWTLEKLLMDQAMGDLQAQLEEMRRLWEEERVARQRAEGELEVLRGGAQTSNARESPDRKDDDEERGTKRQRVE
ncbi:hypothetical protein HWV62_2418 [Athelia sp. TMB]|nr:hypothetical protein HWV62_30615 [Athelia sp. TMB]KAF7977880.1 hypothetical protein HWV62_2418 [Athelia sp. TMB]